jgi:hypothetical protein
MRRHCRDQNCALRDQSCALRDQSCAPPCSHTGTELAAQIRAAVQYSLDTEGAWVLVNHRYIFDLSHMLHYCDINSLSGLRTVFQQGVTLMHDGGLRDRVTVCTPKNVTLAQV